MELLKPFRRKSFFSELLYVALNVTLAVAIFAIVRAVASPAPALLLVLLGKWRVFHVNPRHWLANIQANLLDVIVGMSAVMLMYSVGSLSLGLWLQVLITILYAVWLIVLKPRSTKAAVVAQAAVALFAGTATLFIISYGWPIELVVIGMAVVGYVTARHVLVQFEEKQFRFLSIIWAFIMAQVGWVLSHWVIAYSIPVLDIRIPQAVLVVVLLSFVVYRVYMSYHKHGQVRSADVLLPTVFSVGLAIVLMIFFSAIPVGAL